MKSQIMLNQTITVKKLIDFTLLQLWYADYWSTMCAPEEIKTFQENSFRQQAQGIVILLNSITGPSSFQDYKGILIPTDWLPYFKERETKFEHPTTL